MGVFGSSLERLVVLDNNRRGSDVLMTSSRKHVDNVPIVFQQVNMTSMNINRIKARGFLAPFKIFIVDVSVFCGLLTVGVIVH